MTKSEAAEELDKINKRIWVITATLWPDSIQATIDNLKEVMAWNSKLQGDLLEREYPDPERN